MAEGWRATVLEGARRVGAEAHLRRAQSALLTREQRRDRRDREHLDLLMAFTLGPDDNVLDLGANVGDVLDRIVAHAPNGRHIAYEPLPELAARLAERHPRVDVRAAAVAARSGEATFFRNLRAHSRSSLSRTGADAADLEPLTVRVDGLDEALPEGWVPQLIKIDVEGHEVDVLRGARRVLALHRPIVVIEHGFSDEAGRSSRDLHGLLREAGLAVLDIDGGGPYDADAFVRRAAVGDLWTYVARPAQGVASVR